MKYNEDWELIISVGDFIKTSYGIYKVLELTDCQEAICMNDDEGFKRIIKYKRIIEVYDIYSELTKLDKIKAEFEPSDLTAQEKLMRILAILEG